ncbi:hypothetical protein HPB52_014133 [Rhipicephalus sanguineus]|uniref:Uncharacterized protein n=1 Tax=Rhipicephalus sanguineus TaxID=34632 RepID=A0A9D4SQV0_RHISA|nr:hypothetical protein HPB52_014133 [Rhipicephalus sanguineus]
MLHLCGDFYAVPRAHAGTDTDVEHHTLVKDLQARQYQRVSHPVMALDEGLRRFRSQRQTGQHLILVAIENPGSSCSRQSSHDLSKGVPRSRPAASSRPKAP